MTALRILLISALLPCLWVSSPACQTSQACVPFTGLNGCVSSNTSEPDLPPIDNACCGPQCTYGALNGEPGVCDNETLRWRCLLDTHCECNVTFIYRQMTDCAFRQMNIDRINDGFARLLSFNWTQATCEAQNTKCGLNCCCRETCPTRFCNIQDVTVC